MVDVLKPFYPELSRRQKWLASQPKSYEDYAILKQKAVELRSAGDESAAVYILEDSLFSQTLRLALRFNLKYDGKVSYIGADGESYWSSDAVGIKIGQGFGGGLPLMENFTLGVSNYVLEHYAYKKYVSELGGTVSPEQTIDFAIKNTHRVADYRFGSGAVSRLGWRFFGRSWIPAEQAFNN